MGTGSKNCLPLLFNPLLNCIFNNPQHNKPPVKQTIQELAAHHNEYTLLVPPSYILQDAYDPTKSATKVWLKDMCYNNEDFIQSHIIKSSQPNINSGLLVGNHKNQLVMYNTLNGKQVLIKNGMVFTGRGFKQSLRLNLLGVGQFESFADYFPKTSKFMLIYIEDTLIGSKFPYTLDYIDPKFMPELKDTTKESTALDKSAMIKNDKDTIAFEMLLRSLPLLSKAVSEQYYQLFHHNNQLYYDLRTSTRKQLSFIKQVFNKIVDDAYAILLQSINNDNPDSERVYSLIKNVMASHPDLDVNKLVFEYTEMNLYDRVWLQILYQFNYKNDDKQEFDKEAFKILSAEKYSQLSCLCLNQLDIPAEEPWIINIILKRVSLAILQFSKLNDTSITSVAAKITVINDTINILTSNISNTSYLSEVLDDTKGLNDSELIIDADTLVGILIMVVVHSKIENLEAHLYYIKNFSYNNQIDGYFNYILSNLDAVIYHLSGPEDGAQGNSHLDQLITGSLENFKFWSCILKQDMTRLKLILSNIDDISNTHFIKSRNIHGESCLMFAIKSKNFAIFKLLINHEQWFSIDDLLFDKNTTTGQNLLMVALSEEVPEISKLFVDIILANTELEEQLAYFNLVDDSGRSIGHYLFHDLSLMENIGYLIDWELKDYNSYTPLLTICRCYDHPNYVELIRIGFKCFYQFGKKNFENHIDKNGNTLLHVILNGLEESNLLNEHINVNQFNNKSISPLTLYVKYNRVENLHKLLSIKQLDFLQEEPKNLYNIFDYLSFLVSKPTGQVQVINQIENDIYNYTFTNYFPNCDDVLSPGKNSSLKVFATNARYDTNAKDWIIYFRINENNQTTIHMSLSKLRQTFEKFDISHPFIAYPNKENVFYNFHSESQTVPCYAKYRINRLIETLNLHLAGLKYYSCYLDEFYKSFNDDKLGLDVINHKVKHQDEVKQAFGDIKLTANEINEIAIFLNYTLGDLQEYGKVIGKLNKILIVQEIKIYDHQLVVDLLLNKFLSYESIFPGTKDKTKFRWQGEEKRLDSSFLKLNNFCQWLEISNLELIRKINELLAKVKLWRDIYEKIRSITNEMKKYENRVYKDRSEAIDGHQPFQNHALPESPIAPDHVISNNGELHEESSFFSFGLETKRLRYKRLLLNKSNEIKAIMRLNLEIKLDHEAIASEISNFIKYKSKFLGFGFKQYFRYETNILRQRKYNLEMVRSSL